MRHIAGSSKQDVIIGSDKDRNRGCKKKDKDHIVFLCELCEAQAAQGRYVVHELTSEASSRMKCVVKILAMPGTRAAIADSCTFGLAACDDEGPGFVQHERANDDPTRDKPGCGCPSKCTGTHRHARLTLTTQPREGEQNRVIGSPGRSSNGGTSEGGSAGVGDALKTKERWKMCTGYAGWCMKTTKARD